MNTINIPNSSTLFTLSIYISLFADFFTLDGLPWYSFLWQYYCRDDRQHHEESIPSSSKPLHPRVKESRSYSIIQEAFSPSSHPSNTATLLCTTIPSRRIKKQEPKVGSSSTHLNYSISRCIQRRADVNYYSLVSYWAIVYYHKPICNSIHKPHLILDICCWEIIDPNITFSLAIWLTRNDSVFDGFEFQRKQKNILLLDHSPPLLQNSSPS